MRGGAGEPLERLAEDLLELELGFDLLGDDRELEGGQLISVGVCDASATHVVGDPQQDVVRRDDLGA